MHLAMAAKETSGPTADMVGQVVLSEPDLEARKPPGSGRHEVQLPHAFKN